jgi:hypothetical protein
VGGGMSLANSPGRVTHLETFTNPAGGAGADLG